MILDGTGLGQGLGGRFLMGRRVIGEVFGDEKLGDLCLSRGKGKRRIGGRRLGHGLAGRDNAEDLLETCSGWRPSMTPVS